MNRLPHPFQDFFASNLVIFRRFYAILFIAFVCTFLSACSNAPPAPDWLLNADGALKGFTQAHLTGNTQVADAEFRRARQEISATGQPLLMLRAELTRCAVRQAGLELDDCPAARALIADAPAAELAYASYLRGSALSAEQMTALPESHRKAVASLDDGARVATLQTTTDPLARLIAASVLLRRNALPPAGVALAVETASEQGWRRPLLGWLGVQLRIAQAAGQPQEVVRIQRRITVASGL